MTSHKQQPLPPALLNDLSTLASRSLPKNWSSIDCSPFAFVACNNEHNVFYKQFLARNIWERPKAWLRGSRCKRAVEQASLLPELGFNTPAVLSWGSLSGAREFMLTEAVNGIGVGSCIASYFRQRTSAQSLYWKRQLIRELGAFVGKLHSAGVVHGDLRPNNVLMELGKQPFVFHLIDNERNKNYKVIPHKLIVKNLVQIGMLANIDISNTDRLRFYNSYLEQYQRFTRPESIRLATEVYKTTLQRLSTKKPDRLGSPNLPPQGLIHPL